MNERPETGNGRPAPNDRIWVSRAVMTRATALTRKRTQNTKFVPKPKVDGFEGKPPPVAVH